MSQTKVEAPFVDNNNVRFKNLIINGDMQIAQRATAATASGGDSIAYTTLDRFGFTNSLNGGYTSAQTALSAADQATTGQVKTLDIQCTTADTSILAADYAAVQQKIEAQNLQHLRYGTSSAKSVTLSFWVKSNKTGIYCATLSQEDDSYASFTKEYTISSSDTWEKKTLTFDGDTGGVINNDNGAGIWLMFAFGAGSGRHITADQWNSSYGLSTSNQVNLADSTSNELYLTGVQLEVGTSATDFEFLPFDVNLQRCQRYFYKIESTGTTSNNNITTGFTYGTSGVQSNVKMEVLMRSTPSFSYDIGTNGLVLYNNSDSVTASVPKTYAFAPFGGLLYFDSDLSGTFGATYRPVNVSFNTSPTQTKVLKFDAEL